MKISSVWQLSQQEKEKKKEPINDTKTDEFHENKPDSVTTVRASTCTPPPCCAPASKVCVAVRGGINGGRSHKKSSLEKIIVPEKSCSEAPRRQRHGCRFAEEQEEKEGNSFVQTDFSDLSMHTTACELGIPCHLGIRVKN